MTKRRMRWSNRAAAVFFWLESRISRAAQQAGRAAWALSYCENCGENRYYGRTCREVLGQYYRGAERIASHHKRV